MRELIALVDKLDEAINQSVYSELEAVRREAADSTSSSGNRENALESLSEALDAAMSLADQWEAAVSEFTTLSARADDMIAYLAQAEKERNSLVEEMQSSGDIE